MSTVAPTDRDALAAGLSEFSRAGRTVRVRGGGSGAGHGLPIPADLTLSTAGLSRVIAHEPADLTITVEGGVPAATVHSLAAAHDQAWPQAARRGGATVGGLLATAASGTTRLRWGPIRDSLLEVVIATGDGRLVRAGGRTVKGVAGYDLPRLVVGSLGTLGVIVEATLKLWPVPAAAGWFGVSGAQDELRERAAAVMATRFRPGAVILEPGALWVYLLGAPADVTPPEGMTPRRRGPERPVGPAVMELAVSPSDVADLTRDLDISGLRYRAQFGVGICHVQVAAPDDIAPLRTLAVARGGHGQIIGGTDELRRDPWGPPPAGIEVMRRLRDAFDPAHVLNPGAFVGDARPAPV